MSVTEGIESGYSTLFAKQAGRETGLAGSTPAPSAWIYAVGNEADPTSQEGVPGKAGLKAPGSSPGRISKTGCDPHACL